jgi:hypothetical protein
MHFVAIAFQLNGQQNWVFHLFPFLAILLLMILAILNIHILILLRFLTGFYFIFAFEKKITQ